MAKKVDSWNNSALKRFLWKIWAWSRFIYSCESELWKTYQQKVREQPIPKSASKKKVIKSKPRSRESSPDPVLRANTEVIRKRRPINFTLEDLNEDDDENWVDSSQPKSGPTKSAKKTRSQRKKRNSVKKIIYSEDESD